jgi:hypothetical protein
MNSAKRYREVSVPQSVVEKEELDVDPAEAKP